MVFKEDEWKCCLRTLIKMSIYGHFDVLLLQGLVKICMQVCNKYGVDLPVE